VLKRTVLLINISLAALRRPNN